MSTPYVYLIGWSGQNLFYYGVRTARKYQCLHETGCSPDDLWVTYFTSSKYVEAARRQYGEPDIIQVRHTSNSVGAARTWENKILRRIDAVNRKDFLNQTDNISPELNLSKSREGIGGVPLGTPSSIKGKKAATHVGGKVKYFDPNGVLPEGFSWGCRNKTIEECDKNRQAHLGKQHSIETRQHLSTIRKGANSRGNNPRARKCVVDGIEFTCITDAANHFKVSRSTIRNWIASFESR